MCGPMSINSSRENNCFYLTLNADAHLNPENSNEIGIHTGFSLGTEVLENEDPNSPLFLIPGGSLEFALNRPAQGGEWHAGLRLRAGVSLGLWGNVYAFGQVDFTDIDQSTFGAGVGLATLALTFLPGLFLEYQSVPGLDGMRHGQLVLGGRFESLLPSVILRNFQN